MELEKQRFRSEYLLESANKTLQAGTVAAWLSLPVTAGLMLQDHYLLGLENIWPWRLIGGLPFLVFLAYRYFFASRWPRLAIALNISNMIGILLMMTGIAITVLIDPTASLLNQYGVSVGLLTALFICLIIAVGARKSLVYLIPSVLILASLALFIWGGEIAAERFGFLSNSFIVGILVIIFAIIQDRRQLNDFFLRKKIELRENQLSQKTNELESINQSLESFSYTVSHDLRGPLRNMIGLSTILQRKSKGEAEFVEITETIISNAYKLNQLVDDILSFSTAINQPLKATNLDMTSLFKEVFQELRASENEREINFELEPLEDANGDPAMIRQVIINLLGNALKYTRNESHTLISVSGKIDPEGAYCYQIKDNGVGFNPEQKDSLFTPFSRLHEEDDFEGNGVGLAFIQKILERHHGAIWAEGKENVGATFSFTLPMQSLDK